MTDSPHSAETPRSGPSASAESLPSSVVGLYSFPKSGNTWLRAIIASIAGIPQGPGMMQRYVTDSHYGPVIENPWEFQGCNWYFYKSHRKHILTEHMDQRFATDRVLYIYRHPLDVFVSYLNFVSKNVSPRAGQNLPVRFDRVEDLTPEQMETLFSIWLDHATLFPQNRAFGSVFEHARLFRDRARDKGDTLIMRYEDLQDSFEDEVQRLCDFLGFEKIDIVGVFDMADRRTRQNGKFFWKRQKDNYRNFLSDDQVARFNARWSAEMTELGYEV